MPRYKIKNAQGQVINEIIAEPIFVQTQFPGQFEPVEEPAPTPPPELPPVFRSIDKVEAMGLIRAVTNMTPTQELAFRDDPNLTLFWRIWREDVGGVIQRDHPMTDNILDAVEGAGYLTALQRQALLSAWPTV